MKFTRVKITLLNTHPPVWRKLLLLPEISLSQLHHIIQTVMGWEDSHVHRFSAGTARYSDPRFELEDGSTNEQKVLVRNVLAMPGDSLNYEYDFGDNWQHELLCEGFVEAALGPRAAVCIDGARACPPEDCGGPSGYKDVLHVLKGPNHREYKAIRQWAGFRFDPVFFSVDKTNAALSSLAAHTSRKSSFRRPEESCE